MGQKQKDNDPGKDQELKERMRIRILIPIILGVLITSAVISLIIFYSAPRWISQVQIESIQDEAVSLQSLSKSAGHVAQDLMQTVANDLMALDNLLVMAFNGEINITSDIKSNSTYYFNERKVSEGAVNMSIPGFNTTYNKSFIRSSWYIVGPSTLVDPLNEKGDISGIPTAYQTYYDQWLNLLPLLNTLLGTRLYLNLYSAYTDLLGSTKGLYMMCPLSANYAVYVNSDFTFTARPYYNQSTNQSVPGHTVEFIYPYSFLTNKDRVAYTACVNTRIEAADRVLMCADYVADVLTNYISDLAQDQNATYFIIEKQTANIIVFPNATNLTDGASNITQALFNETTLSTAEQWDFDASFKTLLADYDEDSYSMSFTVGGVDSLLSLSVFEVDVSNNVSIPASQYAVGLVINLTSIQASFTTLEQDITHPILIQIFVLLGIVISLFLFAHFLIGWVSKAITAPINKLVDLLRKINSPDDGEEEEKEGNKGRGLGSCLCCIPNIELMSLELSELHKRFTLLKMSFQYLREAETASNDGDAIISYSLALNIYKELGNVRGIGTVYNNIANIHFKQGNYFEAMKFYEQALERSEQELRDFEEFIKDRKKFSDESSVARVLKRASSSNMFSIDVFDKSKTEFDEIHSNTLYLLAQTRLALEQQAGIPPPGSTTRVRELLNQVIQSDREGQRKPYRVILCLLDIATTFLNNKNITEAEAKMAEASKELKIYDSDTLHGYEDDMSQDYKIPYSILKERYIFIDGRLLLLKKKKKEACRQFTAAIECGKVFDPVIRQKCLRHLEAVFAEQNLLDKAPNIQEIINASSKKNKDIVLLLDYSQSMSEGKRINVVISNILKLFDKYIQTNDRISTLR